jgi:hypothetical protein
MKTIQKPSQGMKIWGMKWDKRRLNFIPSLIPYEEENTPLFTPSVGGFHMNF